MSPLFPAVQIRVFKRQIQRHGPWKNPDDDENNTHAHTQTHRNLLATIVPPSACLGLIGLFVWRQNLQRVDR